MSNGGGGWRTALPSGHHPPALSCAQVERLLARAIKFPCAHNHWIELVLYQYCRVSHQLPLRSSSRQLWGLWRCYQVFAHVGDRHQGLIAQQLGPCRWVTAGIGPGTNYSPGFLLCNGRNFGGCKWSPLEGYLSEPALPVAIPQGERGISGTIQSFLKNSQRIMTWTQSDKLTEAKH